jgi:hypothetical protein
MSKIMSSSSIYSENPSWFASSNSSFPHLFWQPSAQSQNVTVVVENPMTVDDKGKLVSCILISLPPVNWVACVFALHSPVKLFCMVTLPVNIYAGEQRRGWGNVWWEKVAKYVGSTQVWSCSMCL